MKLSRKDWNSYVTKLSKINKTAGRKMQEWIDKHGTDDVEKLIEVAYALATKYGEAASATSCQMYDEVAAAQKVHVPPAEPKPTQNVKYVEKAIRSTLDRAPSLIPSTVSELVKRTGAETTLKNAKRDGAYFAWVPNGDTCAFCITLASNGWRRASEKTINGDHAEHIHKNCDCEFAISFNGPGQIEGYDPDKYLDMYQNAEGNTWEDKVNSMRRSQYAANKDAINAQKRAAYATRMMTRRKIGAQGQEIIDKPTYNKLTRDFKRRGGIIIRGEEAARHLEKQGAYAAYLPGGFDTAYIRDDATVSDVIEEMFHAEQDRRNDYGPILTEEVRLRREIDAQKYLISVEEKYKIPVEEREVTRANLERYKADLETLLMLK